MIVLEVLSSGPLALVQDLGRPGLAHIGVTSSGAADRRAHRLANRLLANPENAATVEITLGGFTARVRGGAVDIAVTGADTYPTADTIPFGVNSVRRVTDGQVIRLGPPAAGVRSYLGVRGGIAVPPVLGSRSYDTLAAIGPPPLQAGDVVPVGSAGAGFPDVELAPVGPITTGSVDLRVVRGPRDDWLTDPDALVGTVWRVAAESDRVGLRLTGPPLRHRWPDRELPSEGATRGAIQIPRGGRPVILGPDHPVTGGYPVVGVIVDVDVDKVAQLRGGQVVRLHWHRPHTAAAGPLGW